ncbi:MAG: sulfite exporter TauE/SafE family protein [Phycisphaerae bacterium]|nr:sulfite exporter TauE/SafE family protein [Phycisphaerae bacterium]
MDYTILAIVGLIAGVLGGLLGIGGAVVMIPAMMWIFGSVDAAGRQQLYQYQAAAMIVSFLMAGPAALKHYRVKAIYGSVWKIIAPVAAVATIAGIAFTRIPFFTGDGAVYIRHAFGAILIYVVLYNIYKLKKHKTDGVSRPEAALLPVWKKGVVGGVMGFFAGLFGIGGGAQAVPMMQIFLHMPLRNAVATSAVTIFSISWIGAIVRNVTLGNDGSIIRSLILAGVLAPTAMIGGYIGGHLTHTLPLRIVRIVFVIVIGIAAWKMFTA